MPPSPGGAGAGDTISVTHTGGIRESYPPIDGVVRVQLLDDEKQGEAASSPTAEGENA